MYERMTNKNLTPQKNEIEEYIGATGCKLLLMLEEMLKSRYDLCRALRFPFGSSYGWGYKYSHKTKHLFYLFFEKDAMTATLQIGDKDVPNLNDILPTLSSKAKSLWENRYPCGSSGGWVHDRILCPNDLDDIIKMIEVRKRPIDQTL